MSIRSFLRYLFFMLMTVVVIAIEKSIGLPIFFLLLALIYIESLSGYLKIISWAVFSFILASFYILPFAISFLLLFSLLFLYEFPWNLWQRESLKVFFALLGTETFLAFFLHLQLSVLSFVYHLAGFLVAFLVIRFWFRQRHGVSKLSVAHRLKS